jgi:hypothetical protein
MAVVNESTPENAAWREFLASTRSGDLVRLPPPTPPTGLEGELASARVVAHDT